MRSERKRRIFTAFTVMVLVVGAMSLMGTGTAGACEQSQVKLPATARGYDVGDEARYLDGVVTNDTTQTLVPTQVQVGWAEDPERTDDLWICGGPIKTGEWTAFSTDWPCDVPATWTPVVAGYASPSDADDKPLPLTVQSVSEATIDGTGARTYSVTVVNGNTVPVSSIDVEGVERDTTSAAFVDTLDACEAPDELAAGESETFDVIGHSAWDSTVTPDIHATALEEPAITLTADSTNPSYGAPVRFTLSLTRADGTPAVGCRTFQLLSSSDGEDWDDGDCCGYDTRTGTAVAAVTPDEPTYYKAVYSGGDDLGCAESQVVFVEPHVAATTPSAPGSVRARRAFKVSGRMSAGSKSAGKPVIITAERKKGSKWVKVATTTAAADNTGRYTKSVKLVSAGTYRIRAYRAGVGYSHYKSLKVKK